MKTILLTIAATLVLTACTPASPTTTSPHGGGHMQSNNSQKRELTIKDQSNEREIAFSILDGENIFTDYAVSHTKEMHLIVVRDDLRHFQHVHPERNADGIWKIPFEVSTGGNYWLYADFIDTKGDVHVIRSSRTYVGAIGDHGIAMSKAMTKKVDGIVFTLQPQVFEGKRVELHYDATKNGEPVTFGTYLGEKGHVVLLNAKGEYIHTHPQKEYVGYTENDPPIFLTPPLTSDFYRMFSQFNIDNEIMTVDFDWQP